MTAPFRLHGFRNSGNAYKVAMMLDLAGCDWEVVPVRYAEGQTRDPAWRAAINEMGEAPVLEHGGERLSQSGVILDYLAAVTGRFGPETEAERREIWRWVLFDNHKFTGSYAPLRYQIGIANTGETPVTEWLRSRARGAFAVLESRLSGRPFVLGERPSIADLSLAGYLYFDEPTGIDRAAEFPAVHRWAARIAALPGWRPPDAVLPAG